METKHTEEHLRLVHEFQTLTGADKLPDMTALESEIRFRNSLLGEGDEPLTDEEIPKNFQRLIELSKEWHTKERPALVHMIEQTIANTFSEEEMHLLVMFASSDVGKRVTEMQGMHVPNCSGVCLAWSMEVLKRFCASDEFKELANDSDGAEVMQAQELETAPQPQPQP